MNEDLKLNIINSLDKGIRLDGRKLDEYRKIEIQTGVYKTAEGSAKVNIGGTEVLAGVKLAVDVPYPDIPDQGTILVNAELLPLSNPNFESGPPDIWSIEIARVVDRGIRESKTIDMNKLCIEKGKKCWMVSIDVVPVNDNGNLLDVSSLAALAALRDARFPTYKDEAVDYKKLTNKHLDIIKLPIGVTVLKIGKNFVVDPTYDEEKVLDARLTVATTDDGKLCALQKGGEKPLSTDDIKNMIDIGIKKGKELRALFK